MSEHLRLLKGNLIIPLFHFTAAVLKCRVSAEKSLPVLHQSASYILFPLDHWVHSVYLKNQMPH